jgi:hypothetical protein
MPRPAQCLEEAVGAVHGTSTGSIRPIALACSSGRPTGHEVSDLGRCHELARTGTGLTAVVREHHHAASNAPHLAQAGDRVLPVMNGETAMAASKDWSSNGRFSAAPARHGAASGVAANA